MAPTAYEEVIIAVMGMTGAGKSSFIRRVTENNDIQISHSLNPGTREVQPYLKKFRTQGTSSHDGEAFAVTLIDCPGFDDPSATDAATITDILTYLNTTYHQGKRLHGIIYMLNITNKRIRNIDRRNIAMFQRLCGRDFYPNVVLGTTHWDRLTTPSEGEARERELLGNPQFWGDFAKMGSKTRRIGLNDRMGDIDVVLEIARRHHPRVLHAQQEMSSGLRPSETSAAREINVWNFFLQEQERMYEHVRQTRINNQRRLAQNRAERQREFEEFQDALSREDEERAMRLARLREEKEFLERALAGDPDPADDDPAGGLKAARDQEREEHETVLLQLRELVMNKEVVLGDRQRREHKENLGRCRRRTLTETLSCQSCERRGLEKIIHVNREAFYHCCYCGGDDYDHCEECGPQCPKKTHPQMTKIDRRKRKPTTKRR